MRTNLCLIAAVWVVLAGSAHAELPLPTCEDGVRGYQILTSQPFSAEDGSLSIAVNAIADNKLIYSDDTKTAFATREQLAEHLKSLSPMDAILWLYKRYTEIEKSLITAGCSFEHKDIVLKSPTYKAKEGSKTCGMPNLPDLSKPLKE